MAECALCPRPAPDAVVCARCASTVAGTLREASDLWPELAVTIARQARMGDPTPRAGRPAPAQAIRPGSEPGADQQTGWPGGLVVDLAAAEVGDVVRNTCSTWARHIAEETGADWPHEIPALLRWHADRCGWVRHQPWAGECLDELGGLCGLLAGAVDRPGTRTRVVVGPCPEPAVGSVCAGDVVAVVPTREDVPAVMRCQACEATWTTSQWARAGRRIMALRRQMREAA